ncbi:MAG: DUF5119 domain-containing protein [Parabacteroides sp.]|nr:DUF5119 domain-containing protein [Parabacteroides sp.]
MACCLIITLVKCSTNETPDVEEQGNAEYSFKWDSLLKRFPAPERLRYCFYPTDGGSMIQMDDDADGLRFTLPPARYKLLVFNCDAANIAFKNMNNFETAEAYIPATKAADGIQSGTIPLYGIAIEELEIKRGSNEPIEFKPEPLVRSLSITIKVEGMEHITSCKGTINDMSNTLNLSKQEVVADATTDQTFETTPSEEGVSANILMLGKPKEKGEEQPDAPTHEVTLDFTLSDGSTASSTVDLGTSLDETEGQDIDVAIEANVTPPPVPISQ